MKVAFTAPHTTTATLTHGKEAITLVLSAVPLGYDAYLTRVYPQPSEVINGVRVAIESAAYSWRYDHNLLVLAKALGDQLDAVAPTTSDPGAWKAYAEAVRAETAAGGFNDDDYLKLLSALSALHTGTGEPGKAS